MSSSVVIGTMPKAAACCNIGSSFWRGAGGAALSSSPVGGGGGGGGGGCLPDRRLKLVMTRAVSSTSVTMVRKYAGMTTKIKSIKARQIIDIRGNPTVEVDIVTDRCFRSAVPSRASTGIYEALELRDGGEVRLWRQRKEMDIDNIMLELDGTANKGKCGANATLGVSVSLC
ncbi:unnamed protein product [Sphagnum jensenii]|uniref:Enolase N-terminal domain-containing protein n=1 Tax=Sphagnum jensenii TaxID=128206 RepID=A0ABP0VKH7_9BRYO